MWVSVEAACSLACRFGTDQVILSSLPLISVLKSLIKPHIYFWSNPSISATAPRVSTFRTFHSFSVWISILMACALLLCQFYKKPHIYFWPNPSIRVITWFTNTGKTRRNHGFARITAVIAATGVCAFPHGTKLARTPPTLLKRSTSPPRYYTAVVVIYIYCPHCKDCLSKSAYYRHRRQFFDRTKKEWRPDVAAFIWKTFVSCFQPRSH